MKHYLLGVVQPTGVTPPAPDALPAIMRDVEAFNDELRAAGTWVFAGGLHGPETATVLRPKDGDVLITDGPYAEGKEKYLGGLRLIRAADLDEALDWGRRAALATTLPIEVRPFVDQH
ncbi:YciI family protein [Streptomyces sp. NPDC049099]|uniref:YciI family protein n=1 Tax=Streptomyces sp. NPDC049099 TaxID=3155768 RepID=UPI00342B3AF7